MSKRNFTISLRHKGIGGPICRCEIKSTLLHTELLHLCRNDWYYLAFIIGHYGPSILITNGVGRGRQSLCLPNTMLIAYVNFHVHLAQITAILDPCQAAIWLITLPLHISKAFYSSSSSIWESSISQGRVPMFPVIRTLMKKWHVTFHPCSTLYI